VVECRHIVTRTATLNKCTLKRQCEWWRTLPHSA